ncbi:hypothetical protein OPU71_18285 [Niveibacterium sp. 24ML]|uniref:hypothetical protein n=1 Tax=Niveibacterium sp. 24ML TaxID=2985512 RepID=UPI00226EC961|nr:hypothetical protein [Niveibacterium sp. 24ML]MCX9158075.1 hypothetical protein [Niveibacterium sp. 24ML]
MLFLNSNDYGFDSQTLGFPSVMGCQALVLLTSHGLYGLHDLKAGTAEAARHKIEFFADWVKGALAAKGGGDKLRLYGVINHTQQYTNNTFGNGEWDAMLLHLAGALEFDGPISKYRVSKHIDRDGSIYIRFDNAHDGNCVIRYKRWSKMESNDSHVFAAPADYGFLRGHRELNAAGTDVTTHFTSQMPGILTNSVNRRGQAGEGVLHAVSARKIVAVR